MIGHYEILNVAPCAILVVLVEAPLFDTVARLAQKFPLLGKVRRLDHCTAALGVCTSLSEESLKVCNAV